MSPVLLSFMAWIVWRGPYQERSNRALASFLTVLAAGFWLEVIWDQTRSGLPQIGAPARALQDILGYLDPPLLLAFALVLTTRPSPRRDWVIWPAYVVAGVFLWATGAGQNLLPESAFRWAHVAYINGTYMVAFLLLLVSYVSERRTFVARQLRYLVLGVGLAAFSRMAALYQYGGPLAGRVDTVPGLVGLSLATAVAMLLLVCVIAASMVRNRQPVPGRQVRTMGLLVGLVTSFFSIWFILVTVTSETNLTGFGGQFYAFRWIAFAGIVAYGLLRYQLFDFDVRARQVAALFGVTATTVVVAMILSWGLNEGGWSLVGARIGGLILAMAVGLPVFLVVDRVGRSMEPEGLGQELEARRRLEIYQATLEFALEKPAWSADERRFVDTLREVFEVTPEEHAALMEKLRRNAEGRASDPPAPIAAPRTSDTQ